jgi:predicted TIM-barrel fold metal-dependent hydrolase
MDFYAAAEELGVVLDFHTGPHWYRIKHYHPLGFDEICWRHPQAEDGASSTSAAARSTTTCSRCWATTCPSAARGHLFGGISSILNRELQRLWYLGIEKVGDAIFRLGEDMPIYGLDFPYNEVELVIQDETPAASGRSIPLRRRGSAKLFGGNLERAINLHSQAAERLRTGH